MANPKRHARAKAATTVPKKGRETTAQATAITKVTQPHGGALNSGGTPGNKGGPGRPPGVIRDKFRQLLATNGIKHVEEVLAGTVILAGKCEKCGHKPDRNLRLESRISDRSQVVEFLARYGIGVRDQLDIISPEVRMRIQQTISLIASRSKWESEELLKALDEVW